MALSAPPPPCTSSGSLQSLAQQRMAPDGLVRPHLGGPLDFGSPELSLLEVFFRVNPMSSHHREPIPANTTAFAKRDEHPESQSDSQMNATAGERGSVLSALDQTASSIESNIEALIAGASTALTRAIANEQQAWQKEKRREKNAVKPRYARVKRHRMPQHPLHPLHPLPPTSLTSLENYQDAPIDEMLLEEESEQLANSPLTNAADMVYVLDKAKRRFSLTGGGKTKFDNEEWDLQKRHFLPYGQPLLFPEDVAPLTQAEIAERLRAQDSMVLLLMLVIYVVTLAFGCSPVYRLAGNANRSTIRYYTDRRTRGPLLACDDPTLDGFLMTFNRKPTHPGPNLQIDGWLPRAPTAPVLAAAAAAAPSHAAGGGGGEGYEDVAEEGRIERLPGPVVAVGRRGYLEAEGEEPLTPGGRSSYSFYSDEEEGAVTYFHPLLQERVLAFSFCLDLDPWIGDMGLISEPHLEQLRRFLVTTNSLETVVLSKQVCWEGWEELATSIKNKIKCEGFDGEVEVHLVGSEDLTILQNQQWSNFIHNRTTQTLCALSGVGLILYLLYTLVRGKTIRATAEFHVDVSVSGYWSIIEECLGRQRFLPTPTAAPAAVRMPSRARQQQERAAGVGVGVSERAPLLGVPVAMGERERERGSRHV
ncbi:unnamed protein product [Vitrella brassicaformis CCMP3155]|uniref:Transmembrane protein n=1 Tax=Vitrella brassicaformis (strain CCMP3155) TaxID=1169540 RepID=A0A0G4EXS5_VITBC|nr:unnamed protein product [Vitrella brassicaformis CCMP3155]|eukprot:CEM04114.1 unnamed protein product [Vitrella brassicaformis CCMP3155]